MSCLLPGFATKVMIGIRMFFLLDNDECQYNYLWERCEVEVIYGGEMAGAVGTVHREGAAMLLPWP